MTPQVHSIELPTGVRLEYAEQGDPGGVPLLLLHGATDSRRSWDTVLPHLPHSAGQARAPYQGEHDRREQHAQEDGAARADLVEQRLRQRGAELDRGDRRQHEQGGRHRVIMPG